MEITEEMQDVMDNLGPIEAQEINLAYTMAYALWFILNDARWRLRKKDFDVDKKRQRRFAELKVSIDKAMEASDALYQDYIKCWGSNATKHDQEQACANTVARLMLLWQDRIGGYDDRDRAVQELMESFPAQTIGDNVIRNFYMKTLSSADDVVKKL